MSLSRILRVVNIFIAVLIVVLLIAGYWVLIRPQPESSGSIAAPVRAAVRIVRGERGVAHVEAGSLDDLFFGQGFATAQDRMWQMDLLRRVAYGEISEVVGRAALELDTVARKFRIRRLAEELTRTLPAADRAPLAAYARGVNHWMERHRDRLPPEFRLLRYEPRPWRVEDSIAIYLQLHRTLTSTWERELEKLRMREGGDAAKVDYLFPLRTGGEIFAGSNAWAISGAWTATGKPILASDPHLEWSLPSIWHEADVQAPGVHAAGVAVVGLPGIAIGHNEEIAWGITSLEFDEQDLYREKIDLRTGQYLYRGQIQQARREPEFIAVRGEKTVEMINWVTVHGPIVAGAPGGAFALRWSAAQESLTFPALELDRAHNWEEFRAAVRRHPGPGFNYIYADRKGNIGHQVGGRLPRRTHNDGDIPADGAAGEAEWEGTIPFDDLPNEYNPASGIVISSNQNPFPEKFAYRIAGHFSPPYRQRQIDARLHSRKGWKASDMLSIQTDVYSASMQFCAQQAVAAVERLKAANPPAGEAAEMLKNWDGQMARQAPAAFLTSLLYQQIRRRVVERAGPKEGGAYTAEMAPAVVERLLRERPKDWFPDYDRMLADAFSDAVEEGIRMQGKTLKNWNYGLYNQFSLEHPVARNVPWLGSYFGIGTVPMSGSSTTVKQTTRRLGPSMRFVADLSDWDNSLLNLVTGNSGHRLTFHYKDQWKAYYAGTSFPLPFSNWPGGGFVLQPAR